MKIFSAVVQMSRPLKKRNLPNHLNKVAPYLQFCSLGAWVPQSLAKVKLIYISCSAQQLYWYPKRNLDISCFHKYVTILFHKYIQLIQWCSVQDFIIITLDTCGSPSGSPSLGLARVCHVFVFWGHTFAPTGFAKLRHMTISTYVHVTHLHGRRNSTSTKSSSRGKWFLKQ